MFIKYIKRLSYSIIFVLIGVFILTIFNYYNITSDRTFSFLELITLLVVILIQSFYLGKKANNKGYLEGIKFGLIIIFSFLLYTLNNSSFHIFLLLYYFMILAVSILGSIIGINVKKRKRST